MRYLIAVDGSECSRRAVLQTIALARCGAPIEIHLLHVCPPVDGWEVRSFLSGVEIAELQQCLGEEDLKSARELLDAAGLAYLARTMVGPVAETIARYADEHGCDGIVMGTRGRGPLSQMLMGSVATEVVRQAHVPVTLVK